MRESEGGRKEGEGGRREEEGGRRGGERRGAMHLVHSLPPSPPSLPPSTAEEILQLRKNLEGLAFELAQQQTDLNAALKDRTHQMNKTVEVERMHVQMREAMGGDITYLRRLNLQLVEQQMKGGCHVTVM